MDDANARRRSTRGWRAAALGMMVVLAGCSNDSPPRAEAAATAPVGWTTATSVGRDLRLILPASLVVFEDSGAIFANEVRPGGEQALQLMAEGPRTAEPQPRSGEDARVWLERKIGAPAQGDPVIHSVDLPVGPALVLERTDRAGTATAWRIAAYAITTDFGVAFLMIDGPPASWVGWDDDVRRIPLLLQVGPGAGP